MPQPRPRLILTTSRHLEGDLHTRAVTNQIAVCPSLRNQYMHRHMHINRTILSTVYLFACCVHHSIHWTRQGTGHTATHILHAVFITHQASNNPTPRLCLHFTSLSLPCIHMMQFTPPPPCIHIIQFTTPSPCIHVMQSYMQVIGQGGIEHAPGLSFETQPHAQHTVRPRQQVTYMEQHPNVGTMHESFTPIR